ncbi:hypothetical protein GCM10010913_01760 [Paenibacillus aceti]|uniref:Uncharacterized protein n=1 Tax=Paenibacillus aceti TaxID=1820010 RepID=A0ABQ1VNN8_9BACL|nr:hypothetical protein GCM10010913_01760 [Paenibacillus aceti]
MADNALINGSFFGMNSFPSNQCISYIYLFYMIQLDKVHQGSPSNGNEMLEEVDGLVCRMKRG